MRDRTCKMVQFGVQAKHVFFCVFFAFIDGEPRCTVLVERKMSSCEQMLSAFSNKTINEFCDASTARNSNCKNTGKVCSKNFKLAIFRQQLFVSTMRKSVQEMLSACCANCTRCSIEQ